MAALDLTTARIVEAHLDAVAILAEAGTDGLLDPGPLDGTTWGVFAAEGPGTSVVASKTPGGWRLSGTKPWCSLAARLTHALVTAQDPDGRRLFLVRLDDPGVAVQPGAWHSRGLTDVPSGPISLDHVHSEPVGPPGWYLSRPGFAYGGIGVAACWYGGAVAVARTLARSARRRAPDQLALWHLGETDIQLHAARCALQEAASRVDAGDAVGNAGQRLALRLRAVVAAAAESVVNRVGHALGPAPLTLDDDHARRVADLTVYLRQHHAERDAVALGKDLLPEPGRSATSDVLLPW